MAVSLISFLSIFHSVNLDRLSHQHKKDSVRADAKPVATAFVFEFQHVAAEIIAHHFHALSDVVPQFFWHGTQLLASFQANFDPVTHGFIHLVYRSCDKPVPSGFVSTAEAPEEW